MLFKPEKVRDAVRAAKNQTEALVLLGLTPQANNFARLQAACVRYGLEVPGRKSVGTPKPPPTIRASKFSDAGNIREACAGTTSMHQALQALGVAPTGKNYDYLIAACAKFGVQPPPLKNNRGTATEKPTPEQRDQARVDKIPKSELRELALLRTQTDILKALKLAPSKANFYRLRKRLLAENIELPNVRRERAQDFSKTPNSSFFALGTKHHSAHVKKRLIASNLIEHNACSACGTGRFWNGKLLELQLDHINGMAHDNRLENLRFLCANCHCQTETFCRPKGRAPKSPT